MNIADLYTVISGMLLITFVIEHLCTEKNEEGLYNLKERDYWNDEIE